MLSLSQSSPVGKNKKPGDRDEKETERPSVKLLGGAFLFSRSFLGFCLVFEKLRKVYIVSMNL